MARPKKESRILSCRLNFDSYDKLDELCDKTGLTKTKVVERALNQYYKYVESNYKAVRGDNDDGTVLIFDD